MISNLTVQLVQQLTLECLLHTQFDTTIAKRPNQSNSVGYLSLFIVELSLVMSVRVLLNGGRDK